MFSSRRSIPLAAVLVLLLGLSASARADRAALSVHPTMTRGMATRSIATPLGQIPRTPPLPDTLRLLAIRVEFAPDTLSTTTGDGTFWQAIPAGREDEDWTIDLPPHDASYFQRQLAAVRRYYERHSGGKLTITGKLANGPTDGGDLFPAADTGAYTLDYPIWHVNYGDGDTERLNETLTQLFVDAWQLADADPAVDVSGYDLFVVFHAGAGNEFDTGYDTTPHDIPSVYIGSEDLDEYAGLPNGLVLSSGAVPDGLILPETQRQDDIEVGLLGTLAHQVGYAIGMPHLYDTETGNPGIGMFGVMDRGFGGFFGLIPTPPNAWTRAYMGWDSVTVVERGDITLGAYGLPRESFGPNLAQLVKVPINSSEYYLLEARLRDPEEDSVAVGWDLDGDTIHFNDEYTWETDPGFDVLYDVDDPDFDLPASGVLIWHIDESVIAGKLADDALQTDPDHRAVDLEEADGSEDIGKTYEFLTAGYGSEYGIQQDAFYKSNDLWRDANGQTIVEFGPYTHPSTTSYTGGESFLTFSNFSAVDDTMTCVVVNTLDQGDFPETLDWAQGNVDISFADLNSDDTLELVLWDETGRVAAYLYDGTPYAADTLLYDLQSDDVMLRVVPGDSAKLLLVGDNATVVIGHDGTSIRGGIVEMTPGKPLAAVANDGWYAVLVDSAGVLVLNRSGDRLPGGMALQRELLANSLEGMPPQLIRVGLPESDTTLVLYGNFEWGLFWREGEALGTSSVLDTFDPSSYGYAVSADFDGDGHFDVVFGSADQRLFFLPSVSASGRIDEVWYPEAEQAGRITLPLDTDDDGLPEASSLGNGRELSGLEPNGLLSEGSPVTLSARLGQPTFQGALIADVDGLGVPDVITYSYLGSGQAAIAAYNSADGTALRDFPLDFGYASGQTIPAMGIADLDRDGDLELVSVTRGDPSTKTLRVWDLNGSPIGTPTVYWGLREGDPTGGRAYPTASTPTGISGPDSFSDAYAWPNPVSDDEIHFRFRAAANGTATLTVYDFISREVCHQEAAVTASTESEITASVANWPSGVYVAKLMNGGKTVLVRFAVMH